MKEESKKVNVLIYGHCIVFELAVDRIEEVIVDLL